MITRTRAKMAMRDTNSESQKQEFDINNLLGMEGSENNTVESDINVTASGENNQSRARGQESEPHEMNFNMFMEVIKQMYEEQRKHREEMYKEMNEKQKKIE